MSVDLHVWSDHNIRFNSVEEAIEKFETKTFDIKGDLDIRLPFLTGLYSNVYSKAHMKISKILDQCMV